MTSASDDALVNLNRLGELYEGKDVNTAFEESCFYCHGDPSIFSEDDEKDKDGTTDNIPTTLKTCTRCNVAKYCSVRCQRAQFEDHKDDCKVISKSYKRLQRLEDELRDGTVNTNWFGPPENPFETSVGHFWGIIETRDYCRQLFKYSQELLHMAHSCEQASVLELALSHQLDLLRLNHSDNQGVQYQTPFILLCLNRDDDCYNFIHFWLTNTEYSESETSEGQWLYPRHHDKHDDLLSEITGNTKYLCLPHITALAIIKLRLLAKYTQRQRQIDAFQQSALTSNHLPDDLLQQEIVDQILPSRDIVSTLQRQVNNVLQIIHTNNPTLLPAILNPTPLQNQGKPDCYSPGSPEEAAMSLHDTLRHFHRIPGAISCIKAIIGNPTSYPHEFTLNHLY